MELGSDASGSWMPSVSSLVGLQTQMGEQDVNENALCPQLLFRLLPFRLPRHQKAF